MEETNKVETISKAKKVKKSKLRKHFILKWYHIFK